jgi:hypothetical protein
LPAAPGAAIARRCASAASRTSTIPKRCRGATVICPLNIALTSCIDEPAAAVSGGPRIKVGLTTVSSVPPPSRAMKSQAARSATVFDFG